MTEQSLQGCQQHHVQGDSLAGAQSFERLVNRQRQDDAFRLAAAVVIEIGAMWTSKRQLQLRIRSRPFPLLLPVSDHSFKDFPLQPLSLPACIILVLDW